MNNGKHFITAILAWIMLALLHSANAQNHWEDPGIFAVNKEEARSSFIPFEDVDKALRGEDKESEYSDNWGLFNHINLSFSYSIR